MTTLYNLTAGDAKILVDHCAGDPGTLAIMLWSTGRAASIDRGLYKAKKLIRFSATAEKGQLQ